jgi:hypothetical protein
MSAAQRSLSWRGEIASAHPQNSCEYVTHVTDAAGVVRGGGGAASGALMSTGFRDGWLTFQCQSERRRLAPAPGNRRDASR